MLGYIELCLFWSCAEAEEISVICRSFVYDNHMDSLVLCTRLGMLEFQGLYCVTASSTYQKCPCIHSKMLYLNLQVFQEACCGKSQNSSSQVLVHGNLKIASTIRNFKKGIGKVYLHKKLPEIDFRIFNKFATVLLTLRVMCETKYQQFCPNLAHNLRENCAARPARTPPSRNF